MNLQTCFTAVLFYIPTKLLTEMKCVSFNIDKSQRSWPRKSNFVPIYHLMNPDVITN